MLTLAILTTAAAEPKPLYELTLTATVADQTTLEIAQIGNVVVAYVNNEFAGAWVATTHKPVIVVDEGSAYAIGASPLRVLAWNN